jgi:hypothetical protein
MKKGVGSGSISHRYGSGDTDPQQNVKDLQHCLKVQQTQVFFPLPVLRIRSDYPGFWIRIFQSRIPGSEIKKAPDPGSGSATKNLGIINPNNCYQALGNMIRDVYSGSRTQDPDFHPSRIQGSKFQRFPDSDPQQLSSYSHLWPISV